MHKPTKQRALNESPVVLWATKRTRVFVKLRQKTQFRAETLVLNFKNRSAELLVHRVEILVLRYLSLYSQERLFLSRSVCSAPMLPCRVIIVAVVLISLKALKTCRSPRSGASILLFQRKRPNSSPKHIWHCSPIFGKRGAAS